MILHTFLHILISILGSFVDGKYDKFDKIILIELVISLLLWNSFASQPLCKPYQKLISAAWRQKGLTGYCFKYIDRPFCL